MPKLTEKEREAREELLKAITSKLDEDENEENEEIAPHA